jgi:hypothetical protein
VSFLFLEIKYARMVGQSVERWKIKCENPFHGNGRCPICKDSQKSLSKCRFHIREHAGTVFVSCFNCGYSANLLGYLKTYHPGIYSELIFEKYKNGVTTDAPIITTPKVVFDDDVLKPVKRASERLFALDLPLVSDLPKDHPVARYVASRMLPDYPFMYAEKFYEFSSQFNEELSSCLQDEPRLIIPFFDRSGNTFAYQGRSLIKNSGLKYVTIRINKTIPNIFGLDRCDFKKPIQIVEGPIDSLFLKNCLASVNASLVSTAEKLKSVINKSLVTLVYDAEPRNKEICKMYQSAISAGYRVVIWPSGYGEKVDINDLVKLGLDPQKIIDQNTYYGLTAQIMFDNWKRI